jgi:hypothetical protein
MADAARARSGWLAGSRGFPMTADALAVHDLTGFENPFAFQTADTARLLRKELMACHTGDGFRFLVFPVREENRALRPGVDHYFFGSVFHFRRRARNEHHREQNNSNPCYCGKSSMSHGVVLPASPVSWQDAKSIGFPQDAHRWVLSNSSEKISFSSPHSLHLQVKDFKCLKLAYPGQCCGVVVMMPPFVLSVRKRTSF